METLKQVIHDIKYAHSSPNKPKITKEYIYHLQSEIDNLEEQLFNSQRNYYNNEQCHTNQSSLTTSSFKQSTSIYKPSTHHLPLKSQEIKLHDKALSTEQSDLSALFIKEKKEFDTLRQIEFNQLKEAKYRCEQLEDDNTLLQNNMNKLQIDKANQGKKIKELQKEIDLLRRKRENKIEHQKQKLNSHFN